MLGAGNRNMLRLDVCPGLSYGLLKKTVLKMKTDLQKLML